MFQDGVTLALGGGGARGFAHVGVLEVLHRNHLKIKEVVGCSAGAVAGAGFALGSKPEAMRRKVLQFADSPLARDPRLRVLAERGQKNHTSIGSRLGRLFCQGKIMGSFMLGDSVMGADYFRALVEFFLPQVNIEDMPIPFAAVATDALSGEAVVLDKGPLRECVLASCSVPGAAPVIEMNGRHLMDGGVICLVPVHIARQRGAKKIFAVNVEREIRQDEPPEQGFEAYLRAFDIQGAALDKLQLADADVVIHPEVGDIHWAEFIKAGQAMDKGKQAAEKSWPEINRLVRRRRWFRRKPKPFQER
ncbi:MAG: patatin-like phospholipase family protein [Desulfarculaceae bacterium]